MRIRIEEIVRKLVLLGVPLLPTAGCHVFEGSCGDDPPTPSTQYFEVARPDDAADAGFQEFSRAAYDRCVEAADCTPLCEARHRGARIVSCTRVPTDAGDPAASRLGLTATLYHLCEGRRPEGMETPSDVVARCELGRWLAHAAYLEAASIPAFDRLARELEAHDAPTTLVSRARTARREERRHARMMRTLARRLDAQVPDIAPFKVEQVRTLDAIAVENAVEGCVRETLGAVIAQHQATWAADPHIRAAMRVIAADEARHADLAWDVDSWIGSVSPVAQASARRAREQTAGELLREVDASLPAALIEAAGFPTAPTARRIVEEMTRTLWTA